MQQEAFADILLSALPMHKNGISDVCHKIIETSRLEKTSKIIESNCQPITTMPTKPRPYSLNQHYAKQRLGFLVMTEMLVSFSFKTNMDILRKVIPYNKLCT